MHSNGEKRVVALSVTLINRLKGMLILDAETDFVRPGVVVRLLGVLNAISPDVLRQPAMSALAIITGGMFAGIFVGKFTRYVSVWLRLPAQNNH